MEDSFDPDEVVQLLGQLEKTKGFNRNIKKKDFINKILKFVRLINLLIKKF